MILFIWLVWLICIFDKRVELRFGKKVMEVIY